MKWVVRIVTPSDPELKKLLPHLNTDWLDILHLAGLAQIHPRAELQQRLGYVCFDLLPPKGVEDTHRWANDTASEIERCYSINAVAAPFWPPEDKKLYRSTFRPPRTCDLCDGSFDPAGKGEKPVLKEELTVCRGCAETHWG